ALEAGDDLGSPFHDELGDRVHVAGPPGLERRALHYLIERAHRRAAMNLIVDLMIFVASQGETGRVAEIPLEGQRHALLGVTLSLGEVARALAREVASGLFPDLFEAAPEVLALDHGARRRVDVVEAVMA